MNSPKVSIIMATYNRGHFIIETLQTIKEQSFTNWECIIIDDGCSDNTKKIITPILKQDDRFQFFKRSDKYKKGSSGCRNFGLDLAKGEYIIFFDDDDIVHKDNLKISLGVVELYDVDYCNYQKSSFEDLFPTTLSETSTTVVNFITKNEIDLIISQKIGMACCTVLWNKKCFKTIRFDEDIFYAEEWECYCRIISDNFKGVIINNILYFNRKHNASISIEFHQKNPIRRKSFTRAILLVVKNLKEKKMLNYSLKRYFLAYSIEFKEYNLFDTLLNIMELSAFEKIKWQLFYTLLPFRLRLYKMKKSMKNK